MIVPMRKVAVFVQSKDAADALDVLGSLGVMHLEHRKIPAGKEISGYREDIECIKRIEEMLAEAGSECPVPIEHKKELRDWRTVGGQIIELRNHRRQLEGYSRNLQKKIAAWEPWGDFEPETFERMREKNIHAGLYTIQAKDMKRLPEGAVVKEISRTRGRVHCALFSYGTIDVPFKKLEIPKMGLEKMRARLSEDRLTIESVKKRMREYICYKEGFVRARREREEKLEFQEALRGMGEAGAIMYATGYIPADAEKPLLHEAGRKKWGIHLRDPLPEERVPTLVRNPRWVSLIEPVFKIIEVVPGYNELDISLWFLIFFSIFFGMLIGDAGYGLIFLGLTFAAQKKWGRRVKDQSPFILFYLLSTFAIVWGVLTVTFFGQEWIPPSVKPLFPALRDSRNIQAFCFFLGALQLSVAHAWRALIKLPSVKALSEAGWILVLWGAFFLAKTLILADPFPAFGMWFFMAGPLLVVLFTNPQRNVLKGIGEGFGNLLLNIVNNFTDIVSYVRLFAVGLATVAVADAFNKMAMQVGFHTILTTCATSLILLLGHALNIVLGPLAILVHGVRLNVLEFCNHLNIAWTGFHYRPLQKKRAEDT